jgi:hypothetical protein
MTVLGTSYHGLLNQFAGDIRSKISKKLEKERNRALYNLNIKHLSTGEGITECRLAEVYKAMNELSCFTPNLPEFGIWR